MDHNVNNLLYPIIHDLNIHIGPYVLRPCDQTIANIRFSWIGIYRVALELSDDTKFDSIGSEHG